jgi:2-methylcitrate dehydratase PrpD
MTRALLDRKITIEHFDGKAYEDAAVRKLMSRVHAAPYTTAQFPEDNHFGAEVKVSLRGGKILSAKVDQPFGRTSDNPLPAGLLKEKFENCAARALSREQTASVYSTIQGLENLQDVRELTKIIAGEGKRTRAAAA